MPDYIKPPGQCARLWLLGTISLILVLSVFVIDASDAAVDKSIKKSNFSKDAMLQAAAAIAGFAIFGSVIGHIFDLKRRQRWTRVIVYFGIIGLITTQFAFLISICCDPVFNEFWTRVWLYLTLVFMLVIAGALTYATINRSSNQANIFPRVFDDGRPWI